ncbi:MAG: hypothetical protein JW741_24500, partial [Sedimentisphaerales bacterium]|nr:hypothetical protein [Sedimentisphaerales bacterium]
PRLKKSLPTKNDSDVFVEETPLGRAVVRDFTYARVLDRLSMYERRIEYSLYKSMNELRRLRLVREIEPATENPPRPDERWGRPDPTSATEPTGGEAERLRQTNPIAGDANGPDQGQRLPCDAKQSQLASGAGAAPEADRAKQTQSAAARTNLPWQKGVCGQAPQMQNKPNLPGRRFAEHG